MGKQHSVAKLPFPEYRHDKEKTMETVKEFPANDITDIQIKSRLSQINMIARTSGNIVLRWTDTKRRTTTVKQFGGELEVMDQGAITFYGILGLIALKEDKELSTNN